MSVPAAEPAVDQSSEIAHRDLVELSMHFAQAYLRFVDAAPDGGLTFPRLRVLEALHCQGPAKMSSLAEMLTLTPRNVTALADSLETEGLVRRVAHPTDRRVTLLELTADGMTVADESLTPRLQQISELFDELSPADQAALGATLQRLVDAMVSAGACDGA
jgi:DNA-binding MarR family transcriptional regulator